MTCPAPESGNDDLAIAWTELRELQHRLAVVRKQEAFLLSAIDHKLIEVDRLAHPEVGEALARIVGNTGRG